jgi:GT2 family glycosyltransferase
MSISLNSALVSVLVATRNRPDSLRSCITTVLASSYPQFEVVVVDQSPVQTVLPTDSRLRVVSSATVGKSRALNLALALARGEVLAFTDDDCTVEPDWIDKGVNYLCARPEVGLIFGGLVPAPHDPAVSFIPSFLPAQLEIHPAISTAQVRAGAGANMFATRKLFAAITGFDELLGPGALFKSCEEFDLYYRTLRAKFAVMRVADNPVTHFGARSVADGAAEQLIRDYWFGEAAVLAKHAKSPDRHALGMALRTFGQEAKWALFAVAHLRTVNLLRAASWARGFLSGSLASVDASRQFFAAGKPRGRVAGDVADNGFRQA